MAEVRHLRNAPITEAIIDFRVKTKSGFDVESFRSLKHRLESQLPVLEEQQFIEGRFEIGPGGKSVSQYAKHGELHGFWFKSSDGLNIAQFRRDGFTFNRLKPYTSWQELFPRVWELWQLYVETGAAEFVTRIATRYINSLALPASRKDLSEFLTEPPSVPEEVSGEIASFLSRIVINTPEGLNANITQALGHAVEPSSVVVILDIDAYAQRELEIGDDSVPRIFSGLRDLKNRIFFSSITEEAARLFE
jgi:uncharacterized protein (TIGR04255 family)